MTLHQTISPAQASAWDESSELLDMLRDDPTDVIAFVAHCSADDLHQFTKIHGVAAEVEIFDAILHHPLCDRATALQIFEACNPQYYEKELGRGHSLDCYDDEEDQVFIAIIDLAYRQLMTRKDWRARFDCPALRHWINYPHTSPSTFKNWPLSSHLLMGTEGKTPLPSIEYRFSSIRLTYQAWQRRQ